MPEKGTSTLRMRGCRQCGIEFMGGPRAWYCPDCAPERYREVDREQSRGWLKRAIDAHGEEYLEEHLKRKRENYRKNTENKRICPMCGGIVPFGEKMFCSDQCRNAAERYAYAKHNYKIGRLKAEPKLDDYKKGGRLYEKELILSNNTPRGKNFKKSLDYWTPIVYTRVNKGEIH